MLDYELYETYVIHRHYPFYHLIMRDPARLKVWSQDIHRESPETARDLRAGAGSGRGAIHPVFDQKHSRPRTQMTKALRKR